MAFLNITFIPFAMPALYTQGLHTRAWAGCTASPSKSLCETLFSQKHNQPPTTHPGLAAEGSWSLSSIEDLGETFRKKTLLSQLARSYLSQRVGDNTASYTETAFSFGARACFRGSLCSGIKDELCSGRGASRDLCSANCPPALQGT